MHVPLFKHLFDWEQGLSSVWHDLPIKFALHSQIYVWFVDSLQTPWFEQFDKHELTSALDWSMFINCWMFSGDRLFKLPNDGDEVKFVEFWTLIKILKQLIKQKI